MMSPREIFERHGADVFAYDPIDGSFKRKTLNYNPFDCERTYKIWTSRFTGKIAGRRNQSGYIILLFMGARIPAHHYVWFLEAGSWPKDILDHINGNPSDNRFCNLREADQSLNRMNQARRSDNKTGVTGVYFNKRKHKWVASICARGKRTNLGDFDSFADAVKIRSAAEDVMGFGPNHGAAKAIGGQL